MFFTPHVCYVMTKYRGGGIFLVGPTQFGGLAPLGLPKCCCYVTSLNEWKKLPVFVSDDQHLGGGSALTLLANKSKLKARTKFESLALLLMVVCWQAI